MGNAMCACTHPRTSHDRDKCQGEMFKDGKWRPCPCRKKYNDFGPFGK